MNPDQEYATPMSAMRSAIQEREYERLKKFRIHVENSAPFFNLREFHEPLFLGSFSWTSPNIKEKWIAQPHARDIGAKVWVTPSEIARSYLLIKYAKRRIRISAAQFQACVKDKRIAPTFAIPGAIYDGAIYFDLNSAYWQIVRAVGWDVDYLPGEYLIANSDMTDFPFRFEKTARNCLVTVGDYRELSFWNGYGLEFRKTNNPLINHVLQRLVFDVLHGVMTDVKNAGARYGHTDGYIVSSEHAQAVSDAIEAWGLAFGIRYHGSIGIVRAVGSYQVGNHQSFPFRNSTRVEATSKVYDPDNGWLRWRFQRLAAQADRDWAFFKGVEGYEE